MTIRTLDKVPLRSHPATFPGDMEDLLTKLPGWTDDVNATATEVATLAAQTNLDAISLAENTPTVLAVANFKGLWSALSGALSCPASVYHVGGYWMLASNLANVAAKEPAVDAEWIALTITSHIYNLSTGVV